MNFGRWTVLARHSAGIGGQLAAILLGFFAHTSAAAGSTVTRLSSQLVSWELTDTLTPAHTNVFPAWVSEDGLTLKVPDAASFRITINGSNAPVAAVTLVRRGTHALSSEYRIDTSTRVLLKLSSPMPDVAAMTLQEPTLGAASASFTSNSESPVYLVNRVGYMPGAPKRGFLYHMLGDWGELQIPEGAGFAVVDEVTGGTVFSGSLRKRSDIGFVTTPLPYQNVWEANFTELTQPGTYRVKVPGYGVSAAFVIDDAVAGQAARSAALGLYHQRSGVALTLPYTRFTRQAGHIAPAEIPGPDHPTNPLLAASAADASTLTRHTAPVLTNVSASLYPFQRTGSVDVSGGHHDAGDYSKYTIDSAQLIHELAFAAEYFQGAGILDNLNLPESGDGIGDLWQIAQREAAFLAKMQDLDGGFYFLVYPRARRYENNVLPAEGDPQVVWPKNTAATAAACAALAQLAGSPQFQRFFPIEAARYLAAATNAWSFLERAIGRYGRDGAYQKLTHYGNDFLHDDEMAWAAAALFSATGESRFETALRSWMPDPASRDLRRWTWWRLYGGWGNALRVYVFGDNRPGNALRNPDYLQKCRAEIISGGMDQVTRSEQCALGLSFPAESKRIDAAGWYFPQAAAFDLVTALRITTDPTAQNRMQAALWANLDYAWGANPSGTTFVTGLGALSPLEPVSQIARNDRQGLPPSGIPVGSPTSGFSWLDRYQKTLTRLHYPPPAREIGRYPLFDRFTDVFNTSTESTIVDMGQCLAVGAALLGNSPLATKGTNALPALTFSGLPAPFPLGSTATLQVSAPGMDLSQARVTWETPQGWARGGSRWTLTRTNAMEMWVEAEALLPDGRRLFGASVIPTVNQSPSLTPKAGTVSLTWPTCSTWVGVTMTDDGLPIAAQLSWQSVTGPGLVDFTDPASAITHVAFSKPGKYVLRCTANDGEFQSSTFVTVTLAGEQGIPPAEGVQDSSALHFQGFKPGTLIDGTFNGGSQLVYGAQFANATPEGVILRTRTVGDTYALTVPDFLTAEDFSPVTLEAYVLIRGYKAYGVSGLPILALSQAWDARFELFDDKWSSGRRPQARVGQNTLVSSTQWDGIVPTNRWIRLTLAYDPDKALCGFWVDDKLVAQGPATMNIGRTSPWTLSVGNADADFDEIRVHRGYGPWKHPEVLATDVPTLAVYHVDRSLKSSAPPTNSTLVATGNVYFEEPAGWMQSPAGYSLGFGGYGTQVIATFPDALLQPDSGQALSLDLRFRVDAYDAYSKGAVSLFSLQQGYDAQLVVEQGKWATAPNVRLGSALVVSSGTWNTLVRTGEWHHLAMQWNGLNRSDFWLDGVKYAEVQHTQNTRRTGDWTLSLGNFLGAVDEIRLSRSLCMTESKPVDVIDPLPPIAAQPPAGSLAAWIPLNNSLSNDAQGGLPPLQIQGACEFIDVQDGSRSVLKFHGPSARAWVDFADAQLGGPTLQLSAWILPEAWGAEGFATVPVVALAQEWDAALELVQDKWAESPDVFVGASVAAPRTSVRDALSLGRWHHLEIVATPWPDARHATAQIIVDGNPVSTTEVAFNNLRTSPWRLELGNFTGFIANVGVANLTLPR